MDVVFLAGPLASGKSTVSETLRELGAWRIDLDQVSRAVTAPGSPCLAQLAEAFGADVVGPDGTLDRALLAERAFATDGRARELEAIELPYIRQTLLDNLSYASMVCDGDACVVVEVPLLDRMEDLLHLADEVLVVSCPEELRRERALGRGVSGEDFDRRSARQPGDDYLRAHGTAVIENAGDVDELRERVREWYVGRGHPARDPNGA